MSITGASLVSIIVPVYNVERYLDACLESIRRQTYKNIEIIIVEDCSTDGSLEAAKAHLVDERVRLIQHQHNGGLSAARNTGIRAALGQYTMFVDSDDVIDRALVEVCFHCASRTGAEVVTYDFIPFNDGDSVSDIIENKLGLSGRYTSLGHEYFRLPHFAWLKFIETRLLHQNKLSFPEGLYYEDWPFHWSLGLVSKKIFQLEPSFYHYRQRETSITGSSGRKLLDLFSVQALVMKMIGAQEDERVRKALGNKLRDSHWSILTRIEESLLPEALDMARDADMVTRLEGYGCDKNIRRFLMLTVVRLPKPVGIVTLKLLRLALFRLAPARLQLTSS